MLPVVFYPTSLTFLRSWPPCPAFFDKLRRGVRFVIFKSELLKQQDFEAVEKFEIH
jgi:hypothetical protein